MHQGVVSKSLFHSGAPCTVSSVLNFKNKREAQRWYRGRIKGLTFPRLIQEAPAGLYELALSHIGPAAFDVAQSPEIIADSSEEMLAK